MPAMNASNNRVPILNVFFLALMFGSDVVLPNEFNEGTPYQNEKRMCSIEEVWCYHESKSLLRLFL